MKPLTEDKIEAATIEQLQLSGWTYAPDLSIAPGSEFQERDSFEQVILIGRLRSAISRLNTTSTSAVTKWHKAE